MKKRISLKQRIINSIESKVQDKVKEHDDWLENKILDYIEYLACDVNNNYDLEQIFEKVKNKEYLDYDKEKCNESY